MQHLVLRFAGIGKMHVFELHAGRRNHSAVLRLRQFGHFEELLQALYRKLHLPHVFGEDFQLCQRTHHGDGQHHGQRRQRSGDGPVGGQRQRYRQGADQRRREQREAQLHGEIGGRQPLDHKGAEIRDGLGVLFIGHARPAKGLDDLDALDILDDGAVHIGVGLVIFLEILAADGHRQHHADHGQRKRDQRGQRQPPVDAQKCDDADNGQHHMSCALGDHVSQRRLQILDLVHHHALDLADGVVFHIAQWRVQETIRQPEPHPFQHMIGHVVRNAGGQRERDDLHGVGQQRPEAPADDR